MTSSLDCLSSNLRMVSSSLLGTSRSETFELPPFQNLHRAWGGSLQRKLAGLPCSQR